MGTIAQKLTYLNNTKQLLKQKINNLGGDITNQTTFREYADELQDIYDNIPKTTGTGTEVSLNTIKGKMSIGLKGNTQQDTTNGYQLLDRSKGIDSVVYRGITITYNEDGSITMNGTTSEAGNVDGLLMGNWGLSTKLINLDTSSQYVLKIDGTTNSKIMLILVNGNNVISYCSGNTPAVFTPAYDGVTLFMIRYSNASANETINFTVYPMLSKGNNTTYAWEPYTRWYSFSKSFL